MNIYRLVCNIIDVKSTKRIGRRTKERTSTENCKRRNGCIDYKHGELYQRPRESREYTGISNTSKYSSIPIQQSKQSIEPIYWKAWSKGKNFLVLLSLFFTPFIVSNLTYFMLLDFSVIGYDIQGFNNLGVYR